MKYIALITLLTVTTLLYAETVSKVLKIVDGDTVKVQVGDTEVNLRLAIVDTPETYRTTKFNKDANNCKVSKHLLFHIGYDAKEYLESILPVGSYFTYTVVDTDRNKRPIVYNKFIIDSIVSNGHGTVEDFGNVPLEVIVRLRMRENKAILNNLAMWRYVTYGCM